MRYVIGYLVVIGVVLAPLLFVAWLVNPTGKGPRKL